VAISHVKEALEVGKELCVLVSARALEIENIIGSLRLRALVAAIVKDRLHSAIAAARPRTVESRGSTNWNDGQPCLSVPETVPDWVKN
jgi:hypothetical protein